MKDHRLIDQRSLAFDRLTGLKLREDPSLIEIARSNLQRWLQTCSTGSRSSLLEWQQLLNGPASELFAVLEGTDERATRLRQSTPFCGILTQDERTRILEEFRSRESTSA